MRAIVTVETRLSRTPDGAVWTPQTFAYRFFTRYLSVFESVRVAARVEDVPTPVDGARRVDGTAVEVWPLPCYVGPSQYLLHRMAIGRAVCAAATETDAVILRAPSPIGSLLAAARDRLGLPYAVEVVADPYHVFAPGVVGHPLRPLLRPWATTGMRRLCRSAVAVAYVTERSLQSRYPAAPTAMTTWYSSVDLPEGAYVSRARIPNPNRAAHTLVSLGSLEQMYKGIDTLIEALARVNTADRPRLRLVHIGDGRFRPQLEQLATRLGVANQVTFTGVLPAGEPVRRQLDAADLFVMPSRTEGLPKALVEAMARALPAIASTAGGIPELLPAEDLVAPDDPAALASAISQLLADPARMASASARNLTRARDFSAEFLTPRRDTFYEAIRQATERRVPTASGRW